MAGKTKKAKRVPRVQPIEGGKIVQVDSVEFAPRKRRGTEYQPILDKMKELHKGQATIVPVPKDVPVGVFHNRINAVLRRFGPEAPKGCKFEKRTTKDGRVAIACVAA